MTVNIPAAAGTGFSASDRRRPLPPRLRAGLFASGILFVVSCSTIPPNATVAPTPMMGTISAAPPAGTGELTKTGVAGIAKNPASTPTPSITTYPNLHTAGPYLMLLAGSGGAAFAYDLDGSGRRTISLPEINTRSMNGRVRADYSFSPDKRRLAFVTGAFDSFGQLPPGGVTLHILDIWTGETKDVASLLPEDYRKRQERMVEALCTSSSTADQPCDYQWLSAMEILQFGVYTVRWSPEGRYLAFIAIGEGDSSDVYLYDSWADETRLLVRDPYNSSSLEWSPDGQWLVYWDTLPTPLHYPSSVRVAHRDGLSTRTVTDFSPLIPSRFEWVSNSEILFYKGSCIDACINLGRDIFLINLVTGNTVPVWRGFWYGAAVDPIHRTMVVEGIPCKTEECDESQRGLYWGPLAGEKKKVLNIEGDLMQESMRRLVFRGGELHAFLVLSQTRDLGISPEGVVEELDSRAFFNPYSSMIPAVSPDRRWMVHSDRSSGLVLFDSSDRTAADIEDTAVYDLFWRGDSKGFYFLSAEGIFYLAVDDLRPQRLSGCEAGMCDEDSELLWAPGAHLHSMPWLNIQPASEQDEAAGKSIWSLTDFEDLDSPATNRYSVEIPAGSAWTWDFSWCTLHPGEFTDFLAPLRLHFLIDGEENTAEVFQTTDRDSGSGYCRSWVATISGWRTGDDVELTIRYTLDSAVNDGKREYPAGNYAQIIAVNVR